MGNITDILKFSGRVSLKTLNARVPVSPESLVDELNMLVHKGLVEIEGPLAEPLHKDQLSTIDAERTTVQLSPQGLKSIGL